MVAKGNITEYFYSLFDEIKYCLMEILRTELLTNLTRFTFVVKGKLNGDLAELFF